MNTRKEKLELAKWAVIEARKAGANDAAVDVGGSRDVEIVYRDGQLDKLTEATVNSLDLTLYVDGKYSSHSTNDLRQETLGRFITEAVAMTKYLGEDPFRALPDPKYYEGMKEIDLGLYDPAYESFTADQMVARAKEIEEIARAQTDLLISCTSSVSSSYSESAKVHSNGFEGTRASSSFVAGAEATVRDGETGRPEDWDYAVTRFLKDLPAGEKIAKTCVERALGKCGQTKLDSGVYEMVVENRALSRLIGAMLGSPMRGSSLQQKTSCYEGKLDQQIAADILTISDDPFIPGALGSRLYDGEGMATKKRPIIENGVLKTFFIDTYYARKLGVEPTMSSSANLVYELGDKSFDELAKSITKGIAVTQFIGGNSNSTTGDFSYGIMGQYVENGKIIQPVNEMNISGNLLSFMTQIDEVGNDPYPYSSHLRPSMKFVGVQFSGA